MVRFNHAPDILVPDIAPDHTPHATLPRRLSGRPRAQRRAHGPRAAAIHTASGGPKRHPFALSRVVARRAWHRKEAGFAR